MGPAGTFGNLCVDLCVDQTQGAKGRLCCTLIIGTVATFRSWRSSRAFVSRAIHQRAGSLGTPCRSATGFVTRWRLIGKGLCERRAARAGFFSAVRVRSAFGLAAVGEECRRVDLTRAVLAGLLCRGLASPSSRDLRNRSRIASPGASSRSRLICRSTCLKSWPPG